MKKIISIVCAIALTASLAFAQENKEHNGQKGKNWFEKIRAEQAAFITQELDLSEAEAQAFWPVYNDVQKQRREAFHNQVVAMKALRDGGDDAEALLDKYLDAKKAMELYQVGSDEREIYRAKYNEAAKRYNELFEEVYYGNGRKVNT